VKKVITKKRTRKTFVSAVAIVAAAQRAGYNGPVRLVLLW